MNMNNTKALADLVSIVEVTILMDAIDSTRYPMLINKITDALVRAYMALYELDEADAKRKLIAILESPPPTPPPPPSNR
jgi:hypothetical protein